MCSHVDVLCIFMHFRGLLRIDNPIPRSAFTRVIQTLMVLVMMTNMIWMSPLDLVGVGVVEESSVDQLQPRVHQQEEQPGEGGAVDEGVAVNHPAVRQQGRVRHPQIRSSTLYGQVGAVRSVQRISVHPLHGIFK